MPRRCLKTLFGVRSLFCLWVNSVFPEIKCVFPSGKSEPAEGFYVGCVGLEAWLRWEQKLK